MLCKSDEITNVNNDYNKVFKGVIRPQVDQTMINIQNIQEKRNATMDVVKYNCIFANADNRGPMNKEYVKFFRVHKPARTTFGGADLENGILVKIECIPKLKLIFLLLDFFIVNNPFISCIIFRT